MASTWLGGRVEASRRTFGLVLGDAAMVALFVLVGEVRHGGSVAVGVETFAQFGVGWLLVSVVGGLYAPEALDGPRRAIVRAVAAWALATGIAQLVRLVTTPGAAVSPAFVLVSIGFGGLFLSAWRYVAARYMIPSDTPDSGP